MGVLCHSAAVLRFTSLAALAALYVGCRCWRIRVFQRSTEDRTNIQSSQWCWLFESPPLQHSWDQPNGALPPLPASMRHTHTLKARYLLSPLASSTFAVSGLAPPVWINHRTPWGVDSIFLKKGALRNERKWTISHPSRIINKAVKRTVLKLFSKHRHGLSSW